MRHHTKQHFTNGANTDRSLKFTNNQTSRLALQHNLTLQNRTKKSCSTYTFKCDLIHSLAQKLKLTFCCLKIHLTICRIVGS